MKPKPKLIVTSAKQASRFFSGELFGAACGLAKWRTPSSEFLPGHEHSISQRHSWYFLTHCDSETELYRKSSSIDTCRRQYARIRPLRAMPSEEGISFFALPARRTLPRDKSFFSQRPSTVRLSFTLEGTDAIDLHCR